MRANRIVRTANADRDLNEIWFYIAHENSEFVADIVSARLFATLDVLAVAPLIGRERKDISGAPRAFPVRPYMIFYSPLAERDGILVWRVLHGARDLRKIVKRPRQDRP